MLPLVMPRDPSPGLMARRHSWRPCDPSDLRDENSLRAPQWMEGA